MDYKKYTRIIIKKTIRSINKGFLKVFSHIYEDSLKGYLLSWLFGILIILLVPNSMSAFLIICIPVINRSCYENITFNNALLAREEKIKFRLDLLIIFIYLTIMLIMLLVYKNQLKNTLNIIESSFFTSVYIINSLTSRFICLLFGIKFNQFIYLFLSKERIQLETAPFNMMPNNLTSYKTSMINNTDAERSRYINIISKL
ncbi:MAG: hypothetical protein J0G32_03950 [Alphaproteobacteria bacterium]|nr:hypothetical protein [Alphaproteobacteria bacterium]OJV16087.1 MAG: hypothetical protein BGO27_03770 [Alphaproteobacteria bacterium 33-17]